MKKLFKRIKKEFPLLWIFVVFTIVNLFCLLTNGYSTTFESIEVGIFNFIFLEVLSFFTFYLLMKWALKAQGK